MSEALLNTNNKGVSLLKVNILSFSKAALQMLS